MRMLRYWRDIEWYGQRGYWPRRWDSERRVRR
jgi:hypothetical protein